jgi:hypothetical protein
MRKKLLRNFLFIMPLYFFRLLNSGSILLVLRARISKLLLLLLQIVLAIITRLPLRVILVDKLVGLGRMADELATVSDNGIGLALLGVLLAGHGGHGLGGVQVEVLPVFGQLVEELQEVAYVLVVAL